MAIKSIRKGTNWFAKEIEKRKKKKNLAIVCCRFQSAETGIWMADFSGEKSHQWRNMGEMKMKIRKKEPSHGTINEFMHTWKLMEW